MINLKLLVVQYVVLMLVQILQLLIIILLLMFLELLTVLDNPILIVFQQFKMLQSPPLLNKLLLVMVDV